MKSTMSLPNHEELISIALKSDKLPSLPSVAMEIVRLCKSDDVPLDELAQVVSIDPSLAAKILRLANSAKYRRNRELTDLDRACFVLGLKTTKIMSLGFSVAEAVKTDDDSQFDYDAYWGYSISCAVAARELARASGEDWENEAFICGLLGRIGQLALAKAMPDEYEKTMESAKEPLPNSAEEIAVFGFDHHHLAKKLLTAWGLPTILVDTVAHWDSPEDGGESKRICQIVQLAARISCLIHESEKGLLLRDSYEMAETNFGMSAKDLDDFVVVLNDEINSLARILDVKIENQDEYQQLIDDAREQMVQVSLQTVMELESTSMDLEHEKEKYSQLECRSEELLKKSQMDSLTGIPNRGTFDFKLRSMVQARLDESQTDSIGLLIFDIDHFKSFNDSYGHLIGDQVLQQVATAVKNSLRPHDFFARYGGEEFVILLGNSGRPQLDIVAERTRKVIESVKIRHENQTLNVTASFGGAFGHRFNDFSDGISLIKLADRCLYEAKNAGRNCHRLGEFQPKSSASRSSASRSAASSESAAPEAALRE